jgi:hypothetical protein
MKIVIYSLLFILISCGEKQPENNANNDQRVLQTDSRSRNLSTSTELYLGENHPLMAKDIFALYQVFFDAFITVEKNSNGQISDSKINFEGMYLLREKKDLEFFKLVSAIENIIKKPNLLSGRSTSYKLSFYINTYNYLLIRIINKNYIKNGKKINSLVQLSSIKDSLNIFDQKVFPLEGELISLNILLHEKILKLTRNADARVLFALNNTTKSSPFIFNKSIKPESLEYDLEILSRANVLLPRIFEQEKAIKKLKISQLFNWSAKIFERDQNGGILGFLRKHLPYGRIFTREYIYKPYDWTLNRTKMFPVFVPTITDLESLAEARMIVVIPDDDVDDDDDDIITYQMKPCKRYQTNPMIDIVARCEKVIEENSGRATRSVVRADLCILEQKLVETNGKIRTISGTLWDKKRKGSDPTIEQMNYFVSEKTKNNDTSFSLVTKNKYKNFVDFNSENLTLNVRQNIRYIAKKYRAVKIQCVGFIK